ncbi:murein hydrolase activator EnvC family protein [Novosphingobium sp. JCM 18896]|uniref:murein hydrolase activator EnvC family protein n=1 Tax=Novosphingobium sp. JCM 18896 TaxID=2989731 RepID=UPI002223E3DB|nr:peptidoglycan DD-metalloendopeptidase family protein [Novosphingobium sp. JCM 18896]MCW1429315.1 peptidoglycan DD-metalloendopeptidase family protein [Novosphingobium sp. JCM 18896]
MTSSRRVLSFLLPASLLAGLSASASLDAQQAARFDDVADARRALVEAQAQGAAARTRAERLEAEAARASAAAEKTAHEAAAIAARIQQTEAEIAGHQAQVALIGREREVLRARLAERQRPVVRLTASLQRLSRRPPALALLRPGSVRETMYMRALLATMLPEVQRRTAALRAEIERGKALQRRAALAAQNLRESQRRLTARRGVLAGLETRQRLESRQVTGAADREAERALALAEQARDLGTLTDDLRKAGALRDRLAQLPGPIMRPARPEAAQVTNVGDAPGPTTTGLPGYMLPVTGRLVSGFGDSQRGGGARVRGIALATRVGAQLVAPAAGRVAFAGPYRGYGNIVIVEHPGGWTSLVTGLARLDTSVGAQLLAGSPLGAAGDGQSLVTLELRRDGVPVDPLGAMRGQ